MSRTPQLAPRRIGALTEQTEELEIEPPAQVVLDSRVRRVKARTFGEFLIEEHVLDRCQLLRALQMQDRARGARLGDCVVALGFASISAIERLHERYVSGLWAAA